MPDHPWPVIHAERASLAEDLAGLADPAWATPSLCAGWSVLQTLGHMTATAKMTPPRFFGHLARAGFRFPAMTERDVQTETAGGPAATLAEFRSVVDASTGPPGPVDSWLGETLVHAEDIRRPLGIEHTYPVDALVRVADFYKGTNLLIGAKRRMEGLTLRATDADWSFGSGPLVTGSILAIVMAMTGRSAAFDQLTGDGVAALRTR
jgi:uncharacterized protein (TIGR03083 family)